MLSLYFARTMLKISFCLFVKSKNFFACLKRKTYSFQPSILAYDSTINKINSITAEWQRAYSPIAFISQKFMKISLLQRFYILWAMRLWKRYLVITKTFFSSFFFSWLSQQLKLDNIYRAHLIIVSIMFYSGQYADLSVLSKSWPPTSASWRTDLSLRKSVALYFSLARLTANDRPTKRTH